MIAPSDNNDTELKKFLVLDKKCHELLQKQVYKQALLYETNFPKLNGKRKKIWIRILEIDRDTKDYYSLRDRVSSEDKENPVIEEEDTIYKK